MEELIELLTQIQELAGVGIEALQQAAGGGEPAPAPEDAGEAACRIVALRAVENLADQL